VPFGETVLFLDEDTEHNGMLTLVSADGSEVTTLQPFCVSDEHSEDELEVGATMITLPEENAVVLGYGFGTACWQRVDLGSGTEVWKTVPSDSSGTSLTSSSGTTIVRNGDEVFLGHSDELATLDLQTGDYHELPKAPDSERVPIGVREGTVVVRAQNQRGTRTFSFQALDVVSGQLRWSVDMGEAEAGDGPGAATIFLSTGDRRFISNVDGDTLHILTFDHDSRELRTDNVTISTGADTKASVASGVNDSLPDLVPGEWRGATVSFGIENTLFVLDTQTAKIEYRYP
jgi:outer membrane protein assembly factor BamB